MKRKRVKKEPQSKKKKKGDEAFGRFLEAICPECQCRLRTDLRVVWCSNPKCTFFIGGLV